MNCLQSFYRFNELIVQDENGSITRYSRSELPPRLLDKVNGRFAEEGKDLVCFYRQNGHLVLTIGPNTFSLDAEMSASIQWEDGRNTFVLNESGNDRLRHHYVPKPLIPPLELDLVSTCVEREDFDMFLFIANVMNDPGRRDRIFR